MQYIDYLPEEAANRQCMVLAREGSYSCAIEPILDGQATWLDLLIKRDQYCSLVRVYPGLSEGLIEDPQKPGVYVFVHATGQFIDRHGGETGRYVTVYAYVNTEVTVSSTPAGVLEMWGQQDIHNIITGDEPKWQT